jgi:CII-binding regulator of phage lambda lysogenization HflD
MPEESNIVLPLVGDKNPTIPPHISVEVLSEASKQVDENFKKMDNLEKQLQEQFNQIQQNMISVRTNKAVLNGQKAILEESKKKIIELTAPPVNA